MVVLPTLSTDGFMTNPYALMIKLFIYYLTAEKRQYSITSIGKDVPSFKEDVVTHQGQTGTAMNKAITKSLESLYKCYFESASVSVEDDSGIERDSGRIGLTITLSCSSKGKKYELMRSIEAYSDGSLDIEGILLAEQTKFLDPLTGERIKRKD